MQTIKEDKIINRNVPLNLTIRTMKKDMQSLRESDVAKEKERIMKANPENTKKGSTKPENNIPSAPKKGVPVKDFDLPKIETEDLKEKDNTKKQAAPNKIQPPKINVTPPTSPKPPLPPSPRQNQKIVLKKEDYPEENFKTKELKELANEIEKQKIFLAESNRKELENQLKEIENKEASVQLEKRKILSNQDKLKEKLLKLQNKKPGWFGKKQSEKEKWMFEKSIKDLDSEIEKVNQEYRDLIEKEEKSKKEIININSSLKKIYETIKERGPKVEADSKLIEEDITKIPESPKINANELLSKIETVSRALPIDKSTRKNQQEDIRITKDKPLYDIQDKQTTETKKEELTKPSQKENIQRKKFLEEIEEWAKSSED